MKKSLSLLIFFLFIFLNGCAQGDAQTSGQGTYEETKKMIVDILKTDEGKKAIKDLLADEEIKKAIVMEQATIKQTVQSSLTSQASLDFWKKAFDDPKFAESFAKSMKTEHEKLLKDLMKDPDYRKSLMEIFKDPQMEKEALDLMTSQKFRAEMQKVVTETFESPLFKAKIQDLLIKGADEMNKEKDKKK